MSMTSAQIDKLRERAKELRNLAPDPDVPYLVPSTKEIMALAMQSAASEMEDAADTIWQLRCRLVDAEDRVRKSGELCKLCEREAENAELRELVRILKNCADECGDCDTCPINGESGVLNPWLGCDSLRDRMRELGVEVDE